MDDLVAFWDIPLSDKVHRIEFEHGTITGKRVIRVDDEELVRKEWMFKLIGSEEFEVNGNKCSIRVDPEDGFSYSYTLTINGEHYKKFTEIQSRALKTWIVNIHDEKFRVVLAKDTLEVSANGAIMDTTAEFVDDGTETHFNLGDVPACIKASTSGNRREGIIYHLIVNNQIVPKHTE